MPDGRARSEVVHTETRVGAEVVAARVVYWVFGVIETLIAVRFLLELFGANPAAGFTRLIYQVSDRPMALFLAVFPTQRVQGAVVDWSALLAIVVYALIAWAIVALIAAATPRESAATVEETEHVEETRRTP